MKFSARVLFAVSLKSARNLLSFKGIIILAYLAVLAPLTGVGINLSITGNFKIPNFIAEAIQENSVYLTIYTIMFTLLIFISIRYIFTFHYMILGNESIGPAMKKSAALLKGRWIKFILDFFVKKMAVFSIAGIVPVILVYLGTELLFKTNIDIFLKRMTAIFLLIVVSGFVTYFFIMSVPYFFTKLTDILYEYAENGHEKFVFEAYKNVEPVEKTQYIKKSAKIFMLGILILFLISAGIYSVPVAQNFEKIFYTTKNIDIIAHRSGGDLAAENSLEGLLEAIKEGATWSEIDIQRTKDGHYIINHDNDFRRLAGVAKSSEKMDLSEIKKLMIKDHFNSERPARRVATLEEFLDAAKGNIGLYLELKGKTADEKMVDDVIEMVREREMETEIVLISLDYNIIKYIKNKYPEIKSGYLYFFAIGDSDKMIGDYLMMEEREATEKNISSILNKGKRAIVWTVNNEESMKRFIYSSVNGIITDHVQLLKSIMNDMSNMSDLELILDKFLAIGN